MKINKKFAKKALLIASLTAGAVGIDSIFNEAQATGKTQYCGPLCSNASHTTYCCKDSGPEYCSAGSRCSNCAG